MSAKERGNACGAGTAVDRSRVSMSCGWALPQPPPLTLMASPPLRESAFLTGLVATAVVWMVMSDNSAANKTLSLRMVCYAAAR